MNTSLHTVPPDTLQDAVRILRAGGLVAFPTETVYGLGADASNPHAIKKIFAAKGRPSNHPVIVHLANSSLLGAWAEPVPDVAWRLAEAFWPGPLTMILSKSARVPLEVTGGQASVGVRVPSHPVALQLLSAFGGGIAAPSANRFGRISPTSAQHVQEELGNSVELIIDGGNCTVGLESTIVDVTGERVRLLRPGGVSVAALEDVLGYSPLRVMTGALQAQGAQGRPDADMRAPGLLKSHYAPRTPTFLLSNDAFYERVAKASVQTGVLARSAPPAGFAGVWVALPDEPQAYAQQLYAALRALDARQLDEILLEAVPDELAWLAVKDRLTRASA